MNTDLIKFAPLFAGLTEQEQNVLAERFTSVSKSQGEAIFRASEKSNALYLLSQGFVRLETQSGQSLATLGPGSVLGESSLFRGTPQDVSTIALANIEYGSLSDQALREAILRQPSVGIKLSKNFGSLIAQMSDYLVARLEQTEEMGNLPHHTLQAVAAQLQPLELPADQPLYQEGEGSQGLFLVESGAIELQTDDPTAHGEQLARSGSLLGTLALLTNKPYTHDAVAVEESILWTISREEFQSLNSQHRGLRRSLGRNVQARLSRADRDRAARRLAEMPVFDDLSDDVLDTIAGEMVLQHISAGERVYRIGEGGDALYMIETGEIELTAENANGVIEELARIGDGGLFGEMSLFTNQIRTEDATATRNTNLWVLHRQAVDALSNRYPEIGAALNQGLAVRLAAEQAEDEQRFRHFELLADLSDEELSQVVQYLQPTRFRQGETIFEVNSPGDTLYFIEAGEVRFQSYNGGSWLIGPGESFGERSLLTNQPHSSAAGAETDVDLWALSKSDFNLLLNRYPSLAITLSRILSQRMTAPEPYAGAPAEQGYGTQRGAYAPQQQGTALSAPPQYMGHPGAMQQQQRMEGQRQRTSIGDWYRGLSGFAKLRLAIIILLLIWLLGIAAPAALISLMQGTGVASGASLPLSPGSLSAVYSMGSWQVAAQDKDNALQIAMLDKLTDATPTWTPHPTQTLQPTATPLPTATPQATATPANSGLPRFIQAVQSVANVGAAAAPAPAPAEEAPAEEAKPALPPRAWDSRLDQLGTRVEEANVESGQQYWRLVEAIWWDEKEAGGKHHIYVELLDESGNRVVGNPVTVMWSDGVYTGPTEDKAWPDYGFNYQMYAAGNAYDVIVEGLPSDKFMGAGLGDLEKRMYGIHVAYLLTYQRVTKP